MYEQLEIHFEGQTEFVATDQEPKPFRLFVACPRGLEAGADVRVTVSTFHTYSHQWTLADRGGPRNSDSYVRWIQPLFGRTGDMGKRRSFSVQFKAKVALEALVGDQTLAELAAKHHLHPNVIA